MNLIGYLIGIAFWAGIAWLLQPVWLKMLCAIPMLVLACMGLYRFFAGKPTVPNDEE